MHQEIKKETNIKVIKLINGDDIVCNLPQKELQLPDNSPLLRLQNHYKLNMCLKLPLLVLEIILH